MAQSTFLPSSLVEMWLQERSACTEQARAKTDQALQVLPHTENYESKAEREGVSCAGCYCGHVNTPQAGELQRREMEENTGP